MASSVNAASYNKTSVTTTANFYCRLVDGIKIVILLYKIFFLFTLLFKEINT